MIIKKPKKQKASDLVSAELLDQLIAQVEDKNAESILGESGLAGQLKKLVADGMLTAEKSVQDSRRRIWLDAQCRQFCSFAELNAWPGERCKARWSELRHPEYPTVSVADLLEQDQAQIMPMSPHSTAVWKSRRVCRSSA